MHYYKRNLGDYAKKAGRLSLLQHGSYTVLTDACYDRERFPTLEQAIEWTWAESPEEVNAVKFILRKFFVLEDGIYVQTRIQEEIAEYHEKSLTNKRIAVEREINRKNKSTKRARTVNEPPPNHKPLTKNQEPLTKNHVLSEHGISIDSWNDFLEHRKSLRKPFSEKAQELSIQKLIKLKSEGFNPKDVIEQSIESGWAGLFKTNKKNELKLENEPVKKVMNWFESEELTHARCKQEGVEIISDLRQLRTNLNEHIQNKQRQQKLVS